MSVCKYALGLQTIAKKKEAILKAKTAVFNKKVFEQNEQAFSFLPLSPLPEKITDKSVANKMSVLEAHKLILESGMPNYAGLQIPVHSPLNSEKFQKYLENYWDWQLPLFIKFGFPLDIDHDIELKSDPINHKSATQFPSHVTHYIAEEKSFNAIIGPFKDPPIQLHTSPFLTREKSNSEHRRVIVDLSWPLNNAVNTHVRSDNYMGVDFALTLPSIDSVTQAVKKFGKNCHIAKIDISRAYKHVPIDPRDIKFLGLFWEDYFIELNLCFGYKNGAALFQRLSDSVRFIMKQEGHYIQNYSDDHLCLGKASDCRKAFDRLNVLLPELGFQISDHKTVKRCTEVICLGILINTEKLTVSVPSEKLKDIKKVCQSWSNIKTCNKRQLQSLLGSLLYITKRVKFSRGFLNRLLQLLRSNHSKKIIKITHEAKKDISWFNAFLDQFNGTSFFKKEKNARHCLSGCLSYWFRGGALQ